MIFTVKTVVGREEVVLNAIAAKAKSENLDIRALAHPEEIKGYIFVEGEVKDIEAVAKTIPHIRGIIKRPIEIREIQRFLEPKKTEIELNKGDIVEIIGGPFKGERGKVVRYENIKREVVVELIEVAVPIPVTVSVEFVKIVEKAK